jgi:hypothetical protein
LRLLQHRADGPVVVPTRVRGRFRRADVEVVAPAGDEQLAHLAGARSGLVITGLAAQMRPARVAVGHFWSGRAASPSPDVATYLPDR